jgi:hypothetical protein
MTMECDQARLVRKERATAIAERNPVDHPAGANPVRSRPSSVTVVQRASSDLRLNPHLHVVFLDGVYREDGPSFRGNRSAIFERVRWARYSSARCGGWRDTSVAEASSPPTLTSVTTSPLATTRITPKASSACSVRRVRPDAAGGTAVAAWSFASGLARPRIRQAADGLAPRSTCEGSGGARPLELEIR